MVRLAAKKRVRLPDWAVFILYPAQPQFSVLVNDLSASKMVLMINERPVLQPQCELP